MIMHRLLARTILASLLYLSYAQVSQAQTSSGSCDTCQQLNNLNAYSADTSTNTSKTNKLLERLLATVTQWVVGTLYDFGASMTAFTAIPAVQNNGYVDQQSLLHTVEMTYQGSKEDGKTLSDNYKTIFTNYLLQESGSASSFDPNNASIASLYLNPSAAGYYSEDQRLAAQRYILLASGAAMSKARKPDNDWLTIRGDHISSDKNKIRENVSAYYTYSAIESAIADNFAYVYGLNTGQVLDGTLDGYSGNMISESGLLTYIQTQKAENEDWYAHLADMGIVGLLREQTILLGGSFLMLSRIEEDLRRILVTNSAQTSLSLIGTQTLTQAISQMPKVPTQPT